MVVDIDDFRKVNDGMGMVSGDELVQQLGGVLKEFSSASVIVSHINSDIYCIAIYEPKSDYTVESLYQKLKTPGSVYIRGPVIFIVIRERRLEGLFRPFVERNDIIGRQTRLPDPYCSIEQIQIQFISELCHLRLHTLRQVCRDLLIEGAHQSHAVFDSGSFILLIVREKYLFIVHSFI